MLHHNLMCQVSLSFAHDRSNREANVLVQGHMAGKTWTLGLTLQTVLWGEFCHLRL